MVKPLSSSILFKKFPEKRDQFFKTFFEREKKND